METLYNLLNNNNNNNNNNKYVSSNGTVCGHEHAEWPQYTVAVHISPCPSEQAVRPGCSAELFLSPVLLQWWQTAQTAKSDCLVV